MSRVSQVAGKHRRIGRIVFVAIAILVAAAVYVAPRASAESAVFNNPRTNVFFRYGVGPVYNGYTNVTQVYSQKQSNFVNTQSKAFGSLKVHHGFVSLTITTNERFIQGEDVYKVPDGDQFKYAWNGGEPLPVHTMIGHSKAVLLYVDVGVHSPSLPNQPKQPHPTGMH